MATLGREGWMKLIEELAASGLTQRDFAEQHGVALGTLQFWIYKVRRETKAPRFVPVRVVGAVPQFPRDADAVIELCTRAGHVLRFTHSAEPKYIAAVVAELG